MKTVCEIEEQRKGDNRHNDDDGLHERLSYE
jgi:hypothetical protein